MVLVLVGVGLGIALIIPGFLIGTLLGAACLRQVDWDMTGPRSMLRFAAWATVVLVVGVIVAASVNSVRMARKVDQYVVGTWELPTTMLQPKPGSRLPSTMRMVLEESVTYRADGTFSSRGRAEIGWEDEGRGRLKFSFTDTGTWERESRNISSTSKTRSVLIDPDSDRSISMNGVTFDSRETQRDLLEIDPDTAELSRVVRIDEAEMEVRPDSNVMDEMRPRTLVFRRASP
ncbi:MAG: hypothetical protein AB8G96_10215 [Phycisphaerales bacterium]